MAEEQGQEPEPNGAANNKTKPQDKEAAAAALQAASTIVASGPGRLTTAYDVQKPVGKGGYAIVHKGIRREDGRIVAVKKVEIFDMTPKKRDRCLQEVTLLRQLSHPCIIQMLDAFIDENMLIIVFEWAPAGDLKRLIKKTAEAGRSLDEPTIWRYFAQIVDGLRYMHGHRIMHRDIKPANVLVGSNGNLKLGDLGLGRQLSHQTMEAFSKVGTPYYVSPEVVRGAGYDWKSDVWSLGCLLYELACLRSPFEMEGAALYDVFQRINKGDYEPLAADTFSDALRNLTARMLSIDPAVRPELEEIWQTCHGCLKNATVAAQVDVHSASEHVHAQLLLLAAQCSASNAAAQPQGPADQQAADSGKTRNGKRQAGNKQIASASLQSPLSTLRLLHGAYFAEPPTRLASKGTSNIPGLQAISSDELQRRQLGAFLDIFAWLLRVAGLPEQAALIDQHIEHQVIESRRPNKRNHNRSQAVENSNQQQDSNAEHTSHRQAGQTTAPSPPPPIKAQQVVVPVCKSILLGADAARRAAQSAGILTDFVSVGAIAAGHGRAVLGLLQDLLTLALRKLPLSVPKPLSNHSKEYEAANGANGADEDGLQEIDDAYGLLQYHSPLPHAYQQAVEAESNADLAPLYTGTQNEPQHQHQQPHQQHIGTANNGDLELPGTAAQRLHSTHIDAEAWRAEAERLSSKLSQIRIKAGGSNGHDSNGMWLHQLEHLGSSLRSIKQLSAPSIEAITKLRAHVSDHLDRIAATEHRLGSHERIAGLLGHYHAARLQLAHLQKDVASHEHLQQLGNAALQQLSDKLANVQQEIQDRAAGLDDSQGCRQLRDVITRLRGEILHMDQRLGTVRAGLLAKQRKFMASNRQEINEPGHS